MGLQKWKLVGLNERVSPGKTRHAHSNSEPQSGPRESVQVSDYQSGTPGLGSGNMERGRVLQGAGGGRGPPEGLLGSFSNHRGFMGLKGPDWSSFSATAALRLLAWTLDRAREMPAWLLAEAQQNPLSRLGRSRV